MSSEGIGKYFEQPLSVSELAKDLCVESSEVKLALEVKTCATKAITLTNCARFDSAVAGSILRQIATTDELAHIVTKNPEAGTRRLCESIERRFPERVDENLKLEQVIPDIANDATQIAKLINVLKSKGGTFEDLTAIVDSQAGNVAHEVSMNEPEKYGNLPLEQLAKTEMSLFTPRSDHIQDLYQSMAESVAGSQETFVPVSSTTAAAMAELEAEFNDVLDNAIRMMELVPTTMSSNEILQISEKCREDIVQLEERCKAQNIALSDIILEKQTKFYAISNQKFLDSAELERNNNVLLNTANQRMMVSFSVESIQQQWFLPEDLEKKCTDPTMKLLVDAMLTNCGVNGKIQLTDDTTVREVIKQIKDLKREGLVVVNALQYMALSIDSVIANPDFSPNEQQILSRVQDRVRRQMIDENTLNEIGKLQVEQAAQKATEFAADVLSRTELTEYSEIGIMLHGGWSYMDAAGKATGHYIDVEVRKVGDRYQFVVANAGEGADKYHTRTAADRGKVTKVFEVRSKEEAQGIIQNIALMAGSSPLLQTASQVDEFYKFFENATVVSDNHIPDRPYQQTVGNCALRNQKELFFHVLQRQGKTELANKLQDAFIERVHDLAQYPALQEEIVRQGKKERIRPFEGPVL